MNPTISKALITGAFVCTIGGTYAISTAGVGVSTFKSHKTMQEIKKNCPDHQTETTDGRCLGRSFRGIYLIRSRGGFSGK